MEEYNGQLSHLVTVPLQRFPQEMLLLGFQNKTIISKIK